MSEALRGLPPAHSLPPPQSMVNTKPEQVEEESEEVREQKHKTFVEKYEKQIKHFGELGAGLRQWGPVGVACDRGWPCSGSFQHPVNTLS